MKKIGLLLSGLLLTMSVHAKETVEVVWTFAISSNSGLMARQVVDNLNTTQNKYQFTFVHKPGAGGTVGTKYVENSNNLSILITSSAFYIRPLLYKDQYDTSKFDLLQNVCVDTPLVLLSNKHNSLQSMIDTEITVGINPGSITELLSNAIVNNNKNVKIKNIHYKGTPEARTDMIGRHIDANIAFFDSVSAVPGTVTVIGITGKTNINQYSTFSQQGIKGTDNLVNSYHAFVPNKVDQKIKEELQVLFAKSLNDNKIVKLCADDQGRIEIIQKNTNSVQHKKNLEVWKSIVENVELK